MLILAQPAKLLAGDWLPNAQTQLFRTDPNPLIGTNFPGGIVIVLCQVLDKVPFGGGQFFMHHGAEHICG